MIDAAHYLGVYDTELIYSWTPREFKNYIKGAQLKIIDEYELRAAAAIFHAKVKSKKRVKLKDVYDADKARKQLDGPSGVKPVAPPNYERYNKAMAAMKNYRPR